MSDTATFGKFKGTLLAGACSLVLLLTSAVWAITWRATDAKAEEARVEVEKLKVKAATNEEKVRALESSLDKMSKTLEDILKELRRR